MQELSSRFKPVVMIASIATPGDDEKKAAGRRVPTTLGSGRVWKKGKTGNDEGDDDLDMTATAVDEEAAPPAKGEWVKGVGALGARDEEREKGKKGDKGKGKNGKGVKDLTMTMMEEHIQEMQKTITAMKKEMEGLMAENKILKEQHTRKFEQDKEDKGTSGRGDQGGRWWEGGRKDDDPWKGWYGGDKDRKGDDAWVEDDGKEDNRLGRDVKDERGTRVDDRGTRMWWEGGNYDRRNEMVARGFIRNTYWKEIKEKVEDVMGESGIAYNRVRVIGEKSSFAIIKFDQYES